MSAGEHGPQPARRRHRWGRRLGVAAATVAAVAAGTTTTSAPAGATLAEQEAYVETVYTDFLYRTPEPEDLAYWAGGLDAGTITRATFLSSVFYGDEFYGAWSYAVHGVYLERPPTPAEHEAAIAALDSAGSFVATETTVLASSAYWTLHGSTSTGFVEAIYQDILYRTGSPADVAYWAGRIDTGTTRGYVANYFVRSAESAKLRVRGKQPTPCTATALVNPVDVQAGSYCLVLDRPADTGGYDYWWPVLNGTGQLPALWRSLAASAEYFTNAQP